MKNYLMFNDPAESLFLAGAQYCELKPHVRGQRRELYQRRALIWNRFLEHCQQTKRPLIILINGCSNAGKSSWALEIAHRLRIRNFVHTDTVRNVLRKLLINETGSAVHHPTYQCWKACAETYSPEALIEGFREQSRMILPYIEALIDESVDNGKFTVIEGMHLIPSLMRDKYIEQDNIFRVFFRIGSSSLQQQRLIRRCQSTYLNRHHSKYKPHAEAFETLRSYLYSEVQKTSVTVVNNEQASKTLGNVMNAIYQHISSLIGDPLHTQPKDIE